MTKIKRLNGTAEQAAEKVENDVFRVIQNVSQKSGRADIEFKRDILPSISEFVTFSAACEAVP